MATPIHTLSEVAWPALAFGPVNLWRVLPAWRLAADMSVTPVASRTEPRRDSTVGVNPKVAQLLSLR